MNAALVVTAAFHLCASVLLFLPWPHEASDREEYAVPVVFERSAVAEESIEALLGRDDVAAIDVPDGGEELADGDDRVPLLPLGKPDRDVALPEVEEALELPGMTASDAALQESLRKAYVAAVSRRLDAVKRYPSTAQGLRVEGTVKISFVVTRTGQVQAGWLVQSSGYAVLDKEALALPQRAGPFAPFPDALASPYLQMTLPIQFTPP